MSAAISDRALPGFADGQFRKANGEGAVPISRAVEPTRWFDAHS